MFLRKPNSVLRATSGSNGGRARMRAVAVAASLVLVGCASPQGEASPEPFTLSIPEADADGRLPEWAMATVSGQCSGENRSPKLEWSGIPEGTVSLAVTMVNPEQLTYPHWVVTDIEPSVTSLESVAQGRVTEGVLGATFFGPGTYVGPCWEDATYTYTVYALDILIEGEARTQYAEFLEEAEGHILAESSVDTLAP